jgi:hypothetical protein
VASRPKRVSLKGKGADIFFGDYAPPSSESVTEEAPAVVAPTPDLEPAEPASTAPSPSIPADHESATGQSERLQASKQETTLASKPSRKRAGRPPSKQASEGVGSASGVTPAFAEIADAVWVSVDAPATITNSFRYTEAELSAVADTLYELSRPRGTRLTKQDIARLGLNVVLDDYRRRGPASLLGQLAARRQRRSG